MPSLWLTSGAYASEALIANAQRCVNLVVEANPEGTKPNAPTTHYPCPGLKPLSGPPAAGRGRGLYPATNGDLYGVVDQSVYYIDPDFAWHKLGDLLTGATTPVSIADNGTQAIVVDGSPQGYKITFAVGGVARLFSVIADDNFVGATRADFLDSFLLLNKPNTNQWYCTTSDVIAFNGLYVGVKTAWPDNILCVIAVEREAYVFGPQKSEVWYNAGAVPFPFQILPGNIIEQGCAAVYSPAKMDTNVYWLSRSPEGSFMVMKANSQNVAQRISTHAIENEFRKYARIDDAVGATQQINGHSYYYLHFPTADKTWGFDEATAQWHEKAAIDKNGNFHRSKDTFCAFAYGRNLALDWATGQLYQVDVDTPTYNGDPIVWIRSFPHTVNEMKSVSHAAITADVETGTSMNTADAVQVHSPWSDGFSSGFGPLTQTDKPQVAMRYSKDGGYKFSDNRIKSNVASGKRRQLCRWRNMGIARDMVYEFSSTAEMIGALNGAYLEAIAGSS